MNRVFVNLGALLSTAFILAGCVAPQAYEPKALNEDAQGIATTRSSPYGCKFLGEYEGKDDVSNQHVFGASLSLMRESATNDLRNNAVKVVANSKKRTVLKIAKETIMCSRFQKCPENYNEALPITSYHVIGEIFECADK